jgi:hypothetical protein
VWCMQVRTSALYAFMCIRQQCYRKPAGKPKRARIREERCRKRDHWPRQGPERTQDDWTIVVYFGQVGEP